MITLMPRLGRHALLGIALALAVVACQAPDAFYRNEQTGNQGQAGIGPTGTGGTDVTGAGGEVTGAAGTTGEAGGPGFAGTTGAAGATGTAGVTGNAGVTGSGGAAGSTGAAGTTGAAGNTGRGGTTGAAGSTGRGGTTGAGGASGRGGSGGAGGRGGTTGTGGRAGTTGTAGAGGAGGAGGSGGASACPTCMIEVWQRCQTDTSNQAVTVTLKVINKGNMMLAFSTITLRYWFSHMITTGSTPLLEIDSSQVIPKAAIRATFTDDYLQIGFTTAAGSLYAFDTTTGTGDLQLRFHPTDYSNWNMSQTDDHSYRACGASSSTYNAWTKTTAYVSGDLVWGTEPLTTTAAVGAGPGLPLD